MAPEDDRMALVKGKGPAPRGRLRLGMGGANIDLSAEPLFRSIGTADRLGRLQVRPNGFESPPTRAPILQIRGMPATR